MSRRTLGPSVWQLQLDSSGMRKSLGLTSREFRQTQEAMRDTEAPIASYERKQRELNVLLRKGAIGHQAYERKMEQFREELRDATGETKRLAEAEKAKQRIMERGASVTQQAETRLQRYRREMRELNQLERKGAITSRTRTQRTGQMRQELLTGIPIIGRFAGALARIGPAGAIAVVTVGTVVAAVVGMTVGMTKAAIETETFNRALNRSLAIASRDAEALRGEFSLVAREIAFNTRFAAEEAASGYEFLIRAGFNAKEALKGAGTAALFAQAGNFGLERATDLLTDAQSALGLSVGTTAEKMANLARVSDVLTRGNQLANASSEQLSQSITNKAGAAARQAGIDVEGLTATLLAYADSGKKAEEAGTLFTIALRDLQTKSIKFSESFKKNSVDVFDAGGNFQGFANILGDLEDRMEGLSARAKKELLLELGFADKSIAAIQILLGTSDKIANYEKQLRKAGGATKEVAEKQLTPFEKSLAKMDAIWSLFAEHLGADLGKEAVAWIETVVRNADMFTPLIAAGRVLVGGLAAMRVVVTGIEASWHLVNSAALGFFSSALRFLAVNPITRIGLELSGMLGGMEAAAASFGESAKESFKKAGAAGAAAAEANSTVLNTWVDADKAMAAYGAGVERLKSSNEGLMASNKEATRSITDKVAAEQELERQESEAAAARAGDVRKMIDGFGKQIDTLKEHDDAYFRSMLIQQQFTRAQADAVIASRNRLKAVQDQQAAEEKLTGQIASLKTETEKFKEELSGLRAAYKTGEIDHATFIALAKSLDPVYQNFKKLKDAAEDKAQSLREKLNPALRQTRLLSEGLSQNQVNQLTAQEKANTQLEKDVALKEKVRRELEEQKTPLEKYREQLNQYRRALQLGFVSQQGFLKLVKAARDDIEKPIRPGGFENDAIEAGSEEAMRLINAAFTRTQVVANRRRQQVPQVLPQAFAVPPPAAVPRPSPQQAKYQVAVVKSLSAIASNTAGTTAAIKSLRGSRL